VVVSIFITPDYRNYQTASDDLGVFLGYVPNDYQRRIIESNYQAFTWHRFQDDLPTIGAILHLDSLSNIN